MGAIDKQRIMSKKAFGQANYVKTPPAGYTPDAEASYNWHERQSMKLPDFQSYIDVARYSVPAYLNLLADVLVTAGYASEEDRPDLLSKLARATGKAEDGIPSDLSAIGEKVALRLNGVNVYWRLKRAESCNGKVIDSMAEGKTKEPDNIGDYFGARLVGDTIDDIVKLRNAVRQHSMTSRKCEYSHPSSEGFRSHKSHHEVSHTISLAKLIDSHMAYVLESMGPPTGKTAEERQRSQQEIFALAEEANAEFLSKLPIAAFDGQEVTLTSKGELFIMDEPGHRIESFTHSLKNITRNMAEACASMGLAFKVSSTGSDEVSDGLSRQISSWSTRINGWASELNMVRTYINDWSARQMGLDALTAPGKERGIPKVPVKISDRVKSSIVHSSTDIPLELVEPVSHVVGRKRAAASGLTASLH